MEVHVLGPMDDGHIGEIARAEGVGDAAVDRVTELAKGNPGATMVLAELIKGGHSESLGQLARAGLRGPAIWVAFKDVCGQDIDLLVSRLAEEPGRLTLDVDATGRA